MSIGKIREHARVSKILNKGYGFYPIKVYYISLVYKILFHIIWDFNEGTVNVLLGNQNI